MKHNILTAWAISATIIAVGAMSYALGKHSALPASRIVPPSALNSTDGNGAPVSASAFLIPERFKGMPTQWRSLLDHNDAQGYAVLFDPATQTFIVEDCNHAGYDLDVNGRPAVAQNEFCKGIAWASMDSLSDEKLVAKSKTGDTLHVTLELDEISNPPILRLSFDEHHGKLIPGSKQDLFATMERTEFISRQKEAFHQAYMSSMALTPEQRASHKREEERRQLAENRAQQGAVAARDRTVNIPADIPHYVIEEAPPTTQ